MAVRRNGNGPKHMQLLTVNNSFRAALQGLDILANNKAASLPSNWQSHDTTLAYSCFLSLPILTAAIVLRKTRLWRLSGRVDTHYLLPASHGHHHRQLLFTKFVEPKESRALELAPKAYLLAVSDTTPRDMLWAQGAIHSNSTYFDIISGGSQTGPETVENRTREIVPTHGAHGASTTTLSRQESMWKVSKAIDEVGSQIVTTEGDIESIQRARAGGGGYKGKEEDALVKEEGRLGCKEQQLRDKKKQLRDEVMAMLGSGTQHVIRQGEGYIFPLYVRMQLQGPSAIYQQQYLPRCAPHPPSAEQLGMPHHIIKVRCRLDARSFSEACNEAGLEVLHTASVACSSSHSRKRCGFPGRQGVGVRKRECHV